MHHEVADIERSGSTLMNYDDLTARVREHLGLSSKDEADGVTRWVLLALAARLTKDEGGDLAAQFPDEVGGEIRIASGTESYGVDGFLARVQDSLDLGNRDEAMRYAKEVLGQTNRLVTAGEIDDVLEQLPDEFSELFMSPSGRT
jgi:uncharacterized protein (DUF2267 family)